MSKREEAKQESGQNEGESAPANELIGVNRLRVLCGDSAHGEQPLDRNPRLGDRDRTRINAFVTQRRNRTKQTARRNVHHFTV